VLTGSVVDGESAPEIVVTEEPGTVVTVEPESSVVGDGRSGARSTVR